MKCEMMLDDIVAWGKVWLVKTEGPRLRCRIASSQCCDNGEAHLNTKGSQRIGEKWGYFISSLLHLFVFSEMTQLLASSAKTRTSPRGCAMIIKFASAATPLSAVEVCVQMQTETHCTLRTSKRPFRSTLYGSTVSYQSSFVVAVCWTKWYDRDNPSGTGDWELLSNLMAENPGEIWYYPMYIEVVTTDTLTPAISTGETFHV